MQAKGLDGCARVGLLCARRPSPTFEVRGGGCGPHGRVCLCGLGASDSCPGPPSACPSSQIPWRVQAGLQLEFVYGYAGKDNTATNLYWTADQKIVYYVAAVGIVYDPETHTQQFFHVSEPCGGAMMWPWQGWAPCADLVTPCIYLPLPPFLYTHTRKLSLPPSPPPTTPPPQGHNDDIKCMAMHPKRQIVATGQVASALDGSLDAPNLCVWDTRDVLGIIMRIEFPHEDGMSSRCGEARARVWVCPCGNVCVCVCARARVRVRLCVCVCVCVWCACCLGSWG